MIGRWYRDLAMGARLTLNGGWAGWTGTLLTALGVGLGVMVLLLAAAAPSVRAAGQDRMDARAPVRLEQGAPTGDAAVLAAPEIVVYRGDMFVGMLLEAPGGTGTDVRPPGIDRLPEAGELYVSPALRDLLDSPENALLAERFEGASVTGLIGSEGLRGPHEPYFYLGTDALSQDPAQYAVSGFGADQRGDGMAAILVLLIVVIIVVLLLPIAAFILTAMRFGAERRDQRLAALRLVGADRAMTRRIAAGESLVGAVLGLVLGTGFFLVARTFADDVRLPGSGVLPADLTPVPLIAALVAVLVPVSAVLVTLLALRRVEVSPLGVFREGTDRGRRLWWRVLVLAAGCAVLAVLGRGGGSEGTEWAVAVGVSVALTGFTLLLPWVVEAVVGRLRGGPLSWQMATRRLQLNSGIAARTVSGVTLAVAGAIALQMLFSAANAQVPSGGDQEPGRVEMIASTTVESRAEGAEFARGVDGARGVESSSPFLMAHLPPADAPPGADDPWRTVVVADCATLGELITFSSCADGDAFAAGEEASAVRPGDRLDLNNAPPGDSAADPRPWTVPPVREARAADPLVEQEYQGLFLTPSTLPVEELEHLLSTVFITLDGSDPDAVEHVRNHIGVDSPGTDLRALHEESGGSVLTSIGDALQAGAVLTMLVIGASMVISTVEQLRERRRQLSVLIAFGTSRSTLAASVLWQTAIPVVLGLAIAVGGGTGLGLLLLRLADLPVADWLSFLPLVGAGLGVIALVTLASLPYLWRMTSPEGLRTE
ncbi:FtsX-like permease family protein [Nocardiopsis alborubida]|uniref:ABC transporter permease n=1 Tax=Nocardiopsis alborubida TaxID=146802 RepID=A0A7X6RNP9_9ACTN|nr:FtsX-like permease family protein [Nocardiopsis alborubida]NKY97030.1 ABC transporter permease [Nocardiopsis alborubida]